MAKNDLKQTVRDLLQRHRYSKLITIGVDGTPRGRIMTQHSWLLTSFTVNRQRSTCR